MQTLEQIVNERLKIEREAHKRWQESDEGIHVFALNLLVEAEYVFRDRAGVYHLKIPVLDRQDATMVTAVLNFSRRILQQWLAVNYPKIRKELGTLTALRQGVPFESLFTQIWHELFGLATQQLVRSGVLFDPAGRLVRYKGSYPTIWRRALYNFNPG